MNINPHAASIQSYVALLKITQNTEQNSEQNANEAPGNIPESNNIIEILKAPFAEHEDSGLRCII